jgi:protein with von Willebrand factor-like domain/uncharacterized protein DUF3520
MTDPTWEIDAPSLAVTILWGDVALHTAHLDPIRSFFLGGAGADCVLPDEAVGSSTNIPLILAEHDAVYLVLHPAMDPEGTITTPGHGARTVADLARPGISEAAIDVPGAFLIKLTPGATAALSLGDFTIAITLETRAACAVAGHYHVSPRLVPFQLASIALHLVLLVLASLGALPPIDPRDPPSDDQVYFIQQALERIDEKEQAELAANGGDLEGEQLAPPRAYFRGFTGSTYDFSASDDHWRTPDRRDTGPAPWNPSNDVTGRDGFHVPIDPYQRRRSSFEIKVDTYAYAAARRSLGRGDLPEPLSVHPEAFVNSFDYRYAGPARTETTPFAVHLDAAPSPFAAGHHLLRIGVQGRRVEDGAPAIIARDARIEVDFQPDAVSSYRLLGFENRRAGAGMSLRGAGVTEDIAAGHSVTAVYDVILTATTSSPVIVRLVARAGQWPGGTMTSTFTLAPRQIAASFSKASPGFRIAVAAASFAEILRNSPYTETWHLATLERIAAVAANDDPRAEELLSLIRTARSLDEAPPPRAWTGKVADASLLGF